MVRIVTALQRAKNTSPSICEVNRNPQETLYKTTSTSTHRLVILGLRGHIITMYLSTLMATRVYALTSTEIACE